MGNKEKILFFDGHCHLCNGLVDELIKRNKQGQLKFAPLQGQTAERLLSPEDRQDLKSLVFWVDGHIYRRSGGAIRAITSLGGFYRIFRFSWSSLGFCEIRFTRWLPLIATTGLVGENSVGYRPLMKGNIFCHE